MLKIIVIVVQTEYQLQLDYGGIYKEEMAKNESSLHVNSLFHFHLV